jgi:hypothetical protein
LNLNSIISKILIENNQSINVTEDDQTGQIRSQPKEWLLHVGVQQLHQHSAAHPAGEGREDVGSDVRRSKIEALP